jgi:hypothetical protein
MITIVWDVDDVLNELMRDWLEDAWLPQHPECELIYEDLRQNPPLDQLGVSRAEYLASLDAFREKYGADLRPNLEVLRWFQEHGHKYNHAVLTAVPLKHAGISSSWVFRHFGRWIQSFNIVPSPRPDEPPGIRIRKKGEFLASWGKTNLFIDDAPTNVVDVQSSGIPCLLYPRPWNGSPARIDDLEHML